MSTRPETPHERREREALEAGLATSPMRGAPLVSRPKNFRPDPASTARALDGPAAWMRRLREIEDETAAHEARLSEAWHALAEDVEDPAAFAAEWTEIAAGWRFTRVNELIDRHNANFPIEARLAMDPRTRDFVRVNGRSYEREPLDAEWILERFPPERDGAMEFLRHAAD